LVIKTPPKVWSLWLRMTARGVLANRTCYHASAALSIEGIAWVGRALGLELLAFDEETVGRINHVLCSVGHPALSDAELAPLRAA